MGTNKIVKAGMGYTIGNILIKGIAFLTLPLFTRLLTTDDFGIYNLYGTYEAIVAIFIGLGMYSSIKNSVYDFPGKKDIYISTMTTIVVGLTIIFLAAVLFLNNILVRITGLNRIILILLILHAFGESMLHIVNAKLATTYDYKSYLGYAGVNTICSIILSLFFVLFIFPTNRSLGRILGASITMTCIGLFILINVYRNSGIKTFNYIMAKYEVVFGLPLVFHYLSQQIASQFDKIMISKMMNNAAVGIYSFAYTIASIFQIIFYSTDSIWSVCVYEKFAIDDFNGIRKKSQVYIALMWIIALSMVVGCNEIIHIMGSKEYWNSASACILVIVGLFFLFLYTLPVTIEYYYKQTKYIATMTIISAIVNIIGNYFLIQSFGYIGAAFSTAISYFVLFIGHWLIAKRIIKNQGKHMGYKFSDFVTYASLLIIISFVINWLNAFSVIKYAFYLAIVSILIFVLRDDILSLIKSKKK